MRQIVSTPPLDLPAVSPITCYSYLTLDHLLTHVSIFNIIAIGIDRFLSIEDPLRYRAKRTSLQVKKIICFVWLGCFFLWLIIVFIWPLVVKGVNYQQDTCNPYYESTPVGSILAALVYFWIPTPILFGLYVKLYSTSARMKQSMRSNCVLTETSSEKQPKANDVNFTANFKVNPQNSTQAAAAAAADISGGTVFVLANKNAQSDLRNVFNSEFAVESLNGFAASSQRRSNSLSIVARASPMMKRSRKSGAAHPHQRSHSSVSARKLSSMFETMAAMAEAQNKKAFKAFTFILGKFPSFPGLGSLLNL